MTESLRVIELRAENFKRLKAVAIQPDRHVVTVAGANGQGKTSVLDAVWFALVGKAGSGQQVVHRGTSHAEVTVDLGDLKVTRRWNSKTGTGHLTVTSANGQKLPTPQGVLDQLIGRLTFDPLAFANASEKEQLAMLLEVVELPFDPDELARNRQIAYDERTIVNREVKRLEGAVASIGDVPPSIPDVEIPVSSYANELSWLQTKVQQRNTLLNRYNELLAELERVRAEGQMVTSEIGHDDPEGRILELQSEISGADEVNAEVRRKRERANVQAELVVKRLEAQTITRKIEAIDQEKRQGIAAVNMPILGLSFDENGVLLNGIPFRQASQAERLRTSVAIAMATNPQVRIIRITDGSLLDSGNMALIAEMARNGDYQVWIERVDESGEYGIVIEDGEVRS